MNYLTMNPEQAFYRAWNNFEFDVTELSAQATSWRGQQAGTITSLCRYSRHACSDSGIYIEPMPDRKPEDMSRK